MNLSGLLKWKLIWAWTNIVKLEIVLGKDWVDRLKKGRWDLSTWNLLKDEEGGVSVNSKLEAVKNGKLEES